MKKVHLLFPIFALLFFANFQFNSDPPNPIKIAATTAETVWVDSIFNSMTLDEKIGQLMWIRAHSDLGEEHIASVKRDIKNFHVGGLCFFQGTPEKQAKLTNEYQKLSKIPLIVSVDAEWGLGMRFKSDGISFPMQLMLGAVQDNSLIYEMGKEIARQCRRIGMHFNFAPVADVNNNINNPVINDRSFGEDPINVAAKSYMYMKGLQDHGVLASAKHFPGHGDTSVDSHYDLPIIEHDMARLDSIELMPFQILFDQGVGGVMVAHLHIPSIDSTPNIPSTLSRTTTTALLKERMNFKGLVITDGLEMEGVTKYHGEGEVEAKAISAGCDIMLLPESLSATFKRVKEYLADGRIKKQAFEESVKKSLRFKYKLGLTEPQQVIEPNIRAELNTLSAKALKRKLIQNALTLVRNDGEVLPFRNLSRAKMATLSIGKKSKSIFQKTIDLYKEMPHKQVGGEISTNEQQRLLNYYKDFETVIVSLHDLSRRPSKNFGVKKSTVNFLRELEKVTKVAFVIFGNPYSLKYFDDNHCVLMAYEENPDCEDLAAQALFGAFSVNGKLPITASEKSHYGAGINSWGLFRLGYGLPEEVGLHSDTLAKIDGLAQKVIDSLAAPGCVVLVAKDNKVVYHKAFGHHQYNSSTATKTTDVFDLASITKVAATTLSTMKLVDEGKISLDGALATYLKEMKKTNKEDMKLADMLSHHAQLKAWIPFFEETITSRKKPMKKWYQPKKSEQFSVKITDNLWMNKTYQDSIWHKITNSDLRTNRRYVYSDLGLILMGRVIEEMTQMGLNQYADHAFYHPLGLQTTTYLPLTKHTKKEIPPTDEDRYWRQQKIQGHVHDMASAMLGGIAGHAGLFSNANDLAILMQMLLNGGYYGGEQYLKPETIEQFTTRCQDCTRRGMGFDMKEQNAKKSQNMCAQASDRTFGHLGFTGTCVWADPTHNLVYVFLSNRTYPKWRGTNILGKANFRPRIQEVIYQAMIP